jgi:hypothetical protein
MAPILSQKHRASGKVVSPCDGWHLCLTAFVLGQEDSLFLVDIIKRAILHCQGVFTCVKGDVEVLRIGIDKIHIEVVVFNIP